MQVGNTGSNFQHKINALISKVAWSVGLDIGDRLTKNARKVKFVVDGPLPPDNVFPERFRDFEVCHHYLQTPTKSIQSRLRKRGRKVITVILNPYIVNVRCAIFMRKLPRNILL